MALLLFRMVIPYPREGYYPLTPDGRVPRALRTFMFNTLLLKARCDPPWAAMGSGVEGTRRP